VQKHCKANHVAKHGVKTHDELKNKTKKIKR